MEEGLILMIPGPTYVRPEVLRACAGPVWGHRDKEETAKRLKPIKENLAKLMEVDESYEIVVSSSSGTGLMEGAVRSCVHDYDTVLNMSIGAFGDLFHEITLKNGKICELMRFNDGKAIDAGLLDDKLDDGYKVLTLTHNETSTGVMNSLGEISRVMKKYSDVLWIVDAVSSFGGVEIPVQSLGIDVLVASSQKCLALPPGLAVGAVSERAMKKAGNISNSGVYFDFKAFGKSNKNHETPTTPNSPLIDALNYQLDYIVNQEGIKNRFARHQRLSQMVQDFAGRLDFPLFSENGYESTTVACLQHPHGLDKKAIKAEMRKRSYLMDTGYRKLEEAGLHTLRIPTMGDITEDMMKDYLGHLGELIRDKLKRSCADISWR